MTDDGPETAFAEFPEDRFPFLLEAVRDYGTETETVVWGVRVDEPGAVEVPAALRQLYPLAVRMTFADGTETILGAPA